MHKIG